VASCDQVLIAALHMVPTSRRFLTRIRCNCYASRMQIWLLIWRCSMLVRCAHIVNTQRLFFI